MTRILICTILNFEEKARNAWYGSSAYASTEALLRRFTADWEHEKGFDLEHSGPLDTIEADEIREIYDERIKEFGEFLDAVQGMPDAGPEAKADQNVFTWFSDSEGCTYEFSWQDLNE